MSNKFLNSEDYQECFKFDGYVPFINSYDFVNSDKNLDCVVFFHKGKWYSYISRESINKTLRLGFQIYSNLKKYKWLKEEIYRVYGKIEKLYIKITNGNVNLALLSDFLSLLAAYKVLYRKTEFFYTDLAFEKLDEFPIIKKNFSDFGEFKMKGRILLNNAIFNTDSYLEKVIKKLSASLEIEKYKLSLSSTPEILNLIKGKKLNWKGIEDRRKSYFIYSEKNKIKILSGKDSEKAIKKFIRIDESKEIKGRVAYKGIIRAKARVIKVDIKNYDEMHKIVDEMKKGDVLVVETTEPSIIFACNKASAIVTNQGEMMSHAAIVAREMKIPCIVGTNNATEMINDGDFIEVDANLGIVKIIKRA